MRKQPLTIMLAAMLGALIILPLNAQDINLPQGVIKLKKQPAPALKLSNLDGVPFNLAAVKNKWKFVHFWASWCGPCRREMPTIHRMSQLIEDLPVEIVLVNTAEDEDTVFTFLGFVAPELSPLMDKDGTVTEQWQPRGLPATFLVAPDNTMHYVALGGRTWDDKKYIEFLKSITAEKY